MITIYLWVGIMILSTALVSLFILFDLGDIFTKFNRLMTNLAFYTQAAQLVLMGLWYMFTKRYPGRRRL